MPCRTRTVSASSSRAPGARPSSRTGPRRSISNRRPMCPARPARSASWRARVGGNISAGGGQCVPSRPMLPANADPRAPHRITTLRSHAVGASGLAHMMEHMAFKGTPWVGTRDAAAERPLLEAEERAYTALAAERRRGARSDSTRLRRLETEFAAARDAADATVETDEFSRILERAGGQNVNAFTSSDVTAYMYSLPSNRLELWAAMEGGRLAHPVFRQFYHERDVVIEERRMSTESSPFGRLAEAFVSEAFTVHPYRFGTIGLPADLQSLSRTAGEAFFHRYYVASNMTIAVVGDVTLAELRALAERYFNDIPAGPKPPAVTAVEPEQSAARRTVLTDAAQPILMMGWHIPASSDPHYVVYTALADLLGGSDYARFQRALVRDKGLSVNEETTIGFPGERFPCMWGLLSIPAGGVAPDS